MMFQLQLLHDSLNTPSTTSMIQVQRLHDSLQTPCYALRFNCNDSLFPSALAHAHHDAEHDDEDDYGHDDQPHQDDDHDNDHDDHADGNMW